MHGLSLYLRRYFHVNEAKAREGKLAIGLMLEEERVVALSAARLIAQVASEARIDIDYVSAYHAL